MMAHGKTESRLTCAGQAAHLGADYSHGLGETFDYLNIGIVVIMFQLLWDVASCEIFND